MSWWRRSKNGKDEGAGRSGKGVSLRLEVNGEPREIRVDARRSLLQVLRQEFGLCRFAGDCDRGDCGGCLILVDDQPRLACATPILEAESRSVTTAEGLFAGDEPGPVPQAFEDHEAFYCGSCTAGHMIAAEGLLRANPNPTSKDILRAMTPVECRCGGQHLFFAAIEKAARLRRGET